MVMPLLEKQGFLFSASPVRFVEMYVGVGALSQELFKEAKNMLPASSL